MVSSNSELLSASTALVVSSYTTFALCVICLAAISLSSYVKIATVLGFLRAGLGFASLPSAFVTGVLALVLSYCVMFPVLAKSITAMKTSLSQSAVLNEQSRQVAVGAAMENWSEFLAKNSHPEEVARFKEVASRSSATKESGVSGAIPFHVLAPAFLVSQLKEAFRIGLRIFLPFLAIDIVVSLLVAAVGIEQRTSLSLAFALKVLLFVLCDGWGLLTGSLLGSFA